jgi:hypothetical protein
MRKNFFALRSADPAPDRTMPFILHILKNYGNLFISKRFTFQKDFTNRERGERKETLSYLLFYNV